MPRPPHINKSSEQLSEQLYIRQNNQPRYFRPIDHSQTYPLCLPHRIYTNPPVSDRSCADRNSSAMAFRLPTSQLCRVATWATPRAAIRPLGSSLQSSQLASRHSRWLATPAYPATQNTVGSKGPTAMVFLNMGGPSTVDEVGDFLSRLFVSITTILDLFTHANRFL